MTEDKALHGLLDSQPFLDVQSGDEETVIMGTYQINETVYGERYFDNFDVKIIITPKYPREIPKVYVFGDRFIKCEHRYPDSMLCLETEHNLKAFLRKKTTLKDFLKEFLTSFFVNFIYFEKHGVYLFGDRSHGDTGVVEMYQERFGTNDVRLAILLLGIVAQMNYRGHMACPCKSGKNIRNCHGRNKTLINMINGPDQGLYKDDYNLLLDKYNKARKKNSQKGAFTKWAEKVSL